MMTTLARIVMMVALEMLSWPRRMLVPLMKVVGKDLGLAPQIIRAIFCSR